MKDLFKNSRNLLSLDIYYRFSLTFRVTFGLFSRIKAFGFEISNHSEFGVHNLVSIMEPLIKTLVIFLSFASLAISVPLHEQQAVQWQSNGCARQCSAEQAFVRFSVGNTYRYRLQSSTAISVSNDNSQQLLIDAAVDVSALSPCDLALRISDARITGVEAEAARALKLELESEALQFAYDSGRVQSVCASHADPEWALDVKKAVVSALQMSARSLTAPSVVVERDISGECETYYSPLLSKYNSFTIQKTKSLDKCGERQSFLTALFPRQYYSDVTSLPLTNASLTCQMTVADDVISGVTCQESQQLVLSRVSLQSLLNLRLESQSKGVSVSRIQRFRQHDNHLRMSSSFGSQNKPTSEADLQELSRVICAQLKSEQKAKSALSVVQSFPELVSALTHVTDKQVVHSVARAVQSGELCSASAQLWDLFLDASALAASEASTEVLLKAYEDKTLGSKRSQVLFSLLAFTSNPNPKAIEKLIPILRKPEVHKHVILGISGLVHNARYSRDISSAEKKSLAEKALEALVSRAQSQKKESEIVSTVKAIENIGADMSSKASELLMKLALDSSAKTVVRVAAIKAVTEALDDRRREQLLEELFAKKSVANELRIQAYKAIAMSGVSRKQLQRIRDVVQSEDNRDIQQYVRSHQKNLKSTSDPHKKNAIPSDAPSFENPRDQWFGVSQNFESSFLLDALGVGVAVEADVIHAKDSSIPRSFTANLTLPAFGRELQLLEVEIRQKGFDAAFEQKIREFRSRAADASVAHQMAKEALDFLLSANQWAHSMSRDVELAIHLKVDGKTLLSTDLSDIKSSADDWQDFVRQLRQRLQIDAAFAVQPVDTRIRLPNANGMPIELRLNATLFAALKATLKADDFRQSSAQFETQVSPSFALQVEAGVAFAAKTQTKAVEVVARLSSAPELEARAEMRDSRVLSVKIVPKERQTLIRLESAVYERDSNGNRKQIHKQSAYDRKYCTEKTRKPLGLEMCAKFGSNPLSYELFIEKTDKSMKSFDFTLEKPSSGSDSQTYRIAFSTPNSEIDRQMSAELQLNRPSSGRQLEAKVQLRSPWMRWSAQSSLRNEEKEQSVALEVQNNGRKVFSLDAGLESQQRGQKREFRPRLRLQTSAQSEPISMQGSVSVAKGRKNQLQINLEGNQKQFLKGSFVREGEKKSNEMRISSDVSLQLPGIEVRINGLADKGSKHMTSDLTVEYRFAGKQSRKESLKVSAKLQNLTQSTLTKMSAFGELTSTQFPNANFHLAYNLLRKPAEHVENELTVAWRQNLNQKVHVLHVTKLTHVTGSDQKLENTLDVEITPLGVNYELRANADLKRDKYSAEVIGKDRTGNKHNDVKATFEYVHVSRAPLHLTMDAVIRTSGREMAYRDVLRETAKGEYAGQTSVQWQNGQKADLDYEYKIKSSGDQFHHEMDAKLKAFGRELRHSGLLRLSRRDLDLKSRVLSDGSQVYEWDSQLSRDRQSRLAFETPAIVAKVAANAFSAPALMAIDISSPINRFQHKTDIEFVPKLSLLVKSDTKRDNRNLLNFQSHLSRTVPSHVMIVSEPIDGRFDLDLLSSDKKSALLDIKSARDDWKHNSVLNFAPKTAIEIKSKTEYKGKPLMSLDSQFATTQKKSFLSLDFPKHKSSLVMSADPIARSADLELVVDDLKHRSEAEMTPKVVKIVSKTDLKSLPIQSLDYHYNRVNGLHSMNSAFGQKYAFEAEGKHWMSAEDNTIEPFVRFGAKADAFDHNSKVTWNRKQSQILVESKSRRNGQNVFDLSSRLSRDPNTESTLRLVTPDYRSSLTATPSRAARLDYNCHHIDHVMSAEWPNSELSFESKTQLKDSSKRFYNLAAKHVLRESYVTYKSQPFDASAHYDRSPASPKWKVAFAGQPQSYYPYTHVTEVEANPRQQQYSIASRTERLANGGQKEPLLALNGRYNHFDAAIPSTLDVKFAQMGAKVKVQPFADRQRFLQVEAKHPKYSHVTDIQVDDKSVNIKSRTDGQNGRSIAKIDSYLTPISGQKSHFSLVTPKTMAQLEYEPNSRAKIEMNAISIPFEHKTEITAQKTWKGVKIVSKTQKSGRNVLSVDSEINYNENPSHLTIQSPLIDSQFSANPSQKWAKIAFKTQSIDHKSELKVNPNARQMDFASKTDYNSQILANLLAKIDAKDRNHRFDVEIPRFAVKTALDLTKRSALVDYRSKLVGRHVLASVAAKDQNGFHAELQWDADKDPNQKLVLDVSAARREGQSWTEKTLVSSVSAAYAGNTLRLESSMAENALIAGPHEWTLAYEPKYNPSRDSMSVHMKHVITGNEMQCNAIYSEGKQLKFAAKVNAKAGKESATGDHVISVSLETTAPKNPDLEVKVSLNERHSDWKRRNAEVFAEVKALRQTVGQTFSASAHVKRDSSDGQKVKASFSVETPQIGDQSVNLVFSARDKEVTASAMNRNGKQLEARAKIGDSSADFDLKSNVQRIPSIRAIASIVAGQELLLSVDADSIRKVDFSAKKSGQSVRDGVEVSARFECPYVKKMETKQKVKINGQEVDFESSVKYDDKPVVSAKFAAQQRSGVWSGAAHVVRNGAELATLSLQSSLASDTLSYALSAKASQWTGIHATLTSQKIGRNERKLFVKMCAQNDVNCVDIKSDVKYRDYSSIPEKAWLSITKMGTNLELKTSLMEKLDDTQAPKSSLLSLTTGQDIHSRVRNQFLVSINSHSIGFDSVVTSRDSRNAAFDSSLKVFFPSNRWLHLKTDFARKQQSIRARTQFVTDADPQPLFESALELQKASQSVRADLQLSSNRFKRSPKSIQIQYSLTNDLKATPFTAKIVLDLARDPNHALTVESTLEQRPIARRVWAREALNTTLAIAVSTRDRSLMDFSLESHVSPQSAGLSVKNIDRRGNERKGFYFARLLDENRFEGVFRDEKRGYRVSGQFGKSAQEVSTDFKVIDEKSAEERDVRLSLSGKCVKMETRKEQRLERRYHFCVNADQSENSIAVDLQSVDNNLKDKSIGVDLQVETRGQKAIKLDVHWSPELLKSLIQKLSQRRNGQYVSSEDFDFISGELLDELRHKSGLISRQLSDDVFEPIASLVSDEMQDVLQEMWRNFGPKTIGALERTQQYASDAVETIARAFRRAFQWYDNAVPQWVGNAYRSAIRSARKQCKRSELCYKALYAFENYGLESLLDLFYSTALETLHTTHRVVMTTSGRLIRALPSAPLWLQSYAEDYKQWIRDSFEAIISSNEDLRQFYQHFRRLFAELLKDNASHIEWQAVRDSARQMADIALSPAALQSSTRVLVWDPENGRLLVEIRAPVVHSRRLRAVMSPVMKKLTGRDSKWAKKWSEAKELFKRMFQ